MRRHIAVLLFLLGAVASTSAFALARPVVALTLTASVVHRDADGTEKLSPATGVRLTSGDVVRYEIVATNTGDMPAQGVRPLDAIPAGTAYVGGSAGGSGKAEFSLDHGKTWSASPTVTVHGPDGDKVVKADPATYTTVRWTLAAPLRPGASAHFAFDVAVK